MADDLLNHEFLKTQLVYDAQPEIAITPPYTKVLWDRQHRWFGEDIARFKPKDKVRFLDVGCGSGHLADSQSSHIDVYMGVDPSMIELRRGKKMPNRYFVHGIGERLDFLPRNSFDVITLVSVLDHCVDWLDTVKQCSEVLRPGGFMLIAMENSDQLPSRIRHRLGKEVEHEDHMHFINQKDIETALGDGFTTLKSMTFGFGFGMHSLHKKIPISRKVYAALVPMMDRIGQLTMPKSGQVLYGCYRKNPDPSAQISESVFRCRTCKADMKDGQTECCGSAIAYADGIYETLDRVE